MLSIRLDEVSHKPPVVSPRDLPSRPTAHRHFLAGHAGRRSVPRRGAEPRRGTPREAPRTGHSPIPTGGAAGIGRGNVTSAEEGGFDRF